MSQSTLDALPWRRRRSRDLLMERVMELAPSVRRAFEVRPSADERAEWLSLTGHQLEALAALYERSLTMGGLCERLDISESAGTALSDRLVAHGMVARETDPADRRVVRLALTDDARAMVERYRQIKSARSAELLSSLRRDDLKRLVHIYETLLSVSIRAAGAGAGSRGGGRSTRRSETSEGPPPAPAKRTRRSDQTDPSKAAIAGAKP